MNDCEGCRAQKIENPLLQTFNAQKKKGAEETSGQSEMSSFKMHTTPKPFSRNVTNLRTMIDFLVHNCLLA
jgi:hypothetical protein